MTYDHWKSTDPRDSEPEDHEISADGCTCRWSTVHSASVDPPHPIRDKWCPVHGMDPDQEYERRRDRDWDWEPTLDD